MINESLSFTHVSSSHFCALVRAGACLRPILPSVPTKPMRLFAQSFLSFYRFVCALLKGVPPVSFLCMPTLPAQTSPLGPLLPRQPSSDRRALGRLPPRRSPQRRARMAQGGRRRVRLVAPAAPAARRRARRAEPPAATRGDGRPRRQGDRRVQQGGRLSLRLSSRQGEESLTHDSISHP